MLSFLLLIAALVEGYIIWNLLRKNERLETMIEDNTERYINIYNTLKEIDLKGAFEADDEVGSAFTEIKDLIETNIDKLNKLQELATTNSDSNTNLYSFVTQQSNELFKRKIQQYKQQALQMFPNNKEKSFETWFNNTKDNGIPYVSVI